MVIKTQRTKSIEPLEKNLVKLIRSLEQKKYRTQHGLFVVEGDKTVREILDSSLTAEYLLAKPAWLEQQPTANAHHIIEISDRETVANQFSENA